MASLNARMAAAFFILSAVSAAAQEKIDLNSGASVHWKLRAQDDSTGNWVDAVVPGSVFTSYVQAGVEKDPNYGDNIYQADHKKYDRNFWYRAEFASPGVGAGKICRLHFKGITRMGLVFFIGVRRGLLYGFMLWGDFD